MPKLPYRINPCWTLFRVGSLTSVFFSLTQQNLFYLNFKTLSSIFLSGLGGENWTPDLLLPKQALYQAKLHPDKKLSICKRTFTATESIITESQNFVKHKKQNPETFWASGFVVYLLTFTIYTQTPATSAHDPLSLNVRYSGACFVICVRLSMLIYMQLIPKNPIHLKIFFACILAGFVFPKLLQYDP